MLMTHAAKDTVTCALVDWRHILGVLTSSKLMIMSQVFFGWESYPHLPSFYVIAVV